jgi:N-acetylglucosamine-6-sulfatase
VDSADGPVIVFAGDSITASGDWSRWLTGLRCLNLAVPGDTSADLRSRIPDILAQEPDRVAILIGTNDFGGLGREPQQVAHDIAAIVEELATALPATRLLLQSIMPRGRSWTPAITTANSLLAEAARHLGVDHLGTWAVLADGERTALDPRFLLDDGFDVHLNEAGYAEWLGILEPALRA